MKNKTKNILMALAVIGAVFTATEASARGRHHHRGHRRGYCYPVYRYPVYRYPVYRTPLVYTTSVVYTQQPATQVQQPATQVQQPAAQVQQPATRVVYGQPVVVPAPLPATVAGVDAVGGTTTFGAAQIINTTTTHTNTLIGNVFKIITWPVAKLAELTEPAPVCRKHAQKVCHKCAEIEQAKQNAKQNTK